MIEMLEGVPGSGKSYYAVAERLLKWVRAGRRVYCYVDGIYLDRLSVFEGVPLEVLQKQITIWTTAEEVKTGLLRVEPGSAVLIDEVQTVFRSREKQEPELLRWLETHRHKGIDLVMMCQQYGQVTLGVNRLVETTIKFRRLDRFGLKNRYQAAVRGNPEELETIRMFSGRYEPKVYAYYSSYSSGTIRETVRGGSILSSPTLIVGLVGLVVAVGWFGFGGWLSGASPRAEVVSVPVSLSPPPSMPVSTPVVHPVVESPVVHPVIIQGGMTTMRDGVVEWLWLTESGQFLTEDDIAAESSGTVISKMVRGVRTLSGTGVMYGSRRKEAESLVPVFGRSSSIASTVPEENPNHRETQPLPSPGPGDLVASPPGILATPSASSLSTPPGL